MNKQQAKFLPRKFVLWGVFVVIITTFCGLVYLVVQQDMRQGANDPQIQMAEDTAIALNAGKKVEPKGSINVANSLAPFMISYNTQGQAILSGTTLNGETPQIPEGVFTSVRNNGEQRFTWQPQSGVRIAAVVTAYKGGYVLAGRSLREVEKRENQLTQEVGVVWVVSMGIVTVLSFLL